MLTIARKISLGVPFTHSGVTLKETGALLIDDSVSPDICKVLGLFTTEHISPETIYLATYYTQVEKRGRNALLKIIFSTSMTIEDMQELQQDATLVYFTEAFGMLALHYGFGGSNLSPNQIEKSIRNKVNNAFKEILCT